MKIYAVIENVDLGYHVLYVDTDSTRAHEKLNELIGAVKEYSIANEISMALKCRNKVLSREEAESYVRKKYITYDIIEIEAGDTEAIQKDIGMWNRITERMKNENP